MRRFGLILASALTVIVTCAALGYCGWFSARAAHSSASRPTDPYNNTAMARWRHNQPSHWRAFLLQP
jgi:hypothetical protein